MIAESEGLEGVRIDAIDGENLTAGGWASLGKPTDLSKVRGQAHLRHALLSDRNYVWSEPIDAESQQWGWCFRFHEGPLEAFVLLSEDLRKLGKYETTSKAVSGYSCAPMAASLESYLGSLKLSSGTEPFQASSSASSAAE